jgi:hypothetical protein
MFTRRTSHRDRAIGLLAHGLRRLHQETLDAIGLDVCKGLSIDARSAVVLAYQLPGALQDVRQVHLIVQSMEAASFVCLRGFV